MSSVSTMSELDSMRQNNRQDVPVVVKEPTESESDEEYVRSILEKWQSGRYINDLDKCNCMSYLFDEISNIKEELKNGK